MLAQEEARLLGHDYIGTEHLLLGLVHEGDGIAAKTLERLGVHLEPVRARIEHLVGQGGMTPTGHIPFTPRAKKVLELSLRESLLLRHNYIGTEHILLGLVREGRGVALQVLTQLGVDLARLRDEVIQSLSSHPTASSGGRLEPPDALATAEAVAAYVELPAKANELLERLARHSDPEVVDIAVQLRKASDDFNRVGVERLVAFIMAWGGEIFFDAVFDDPIAAAFLSGYGIAKPG